jgi:hypothetical protein
MLASKDKLCSMELDVKKSHTDFRDYTCITVSDEHAIKADKRGQFKK